MTRAALFALALALALAACTAPERSPETSAGGGMAQEGSRVTTPTPTPTRSAAESEPERDACGAATVSARFTGAKATADTRAKIADAVGKRVIRYYAEGDPITMDYSEERLNVVLSKDGRIIEFRCG